jgi:molybdate transport system substrate-binding protein
MDTLVIVFEKESGIKANIILGSSGKLTAQILQGAPYDIFVSANMKYPMEVFKNGLALGEPKVYAYGSLVLWTPKEFTVSSLDILKDAEIRKIAIPNPRTAVYGEAAVELLKNKGIFEVVKDKLVYGESITQVSQFLISKAADIGFSAKSIVLSPEMRNIGSWFEVDPQGYTPIQQGVIIVNRNNNRLDQAEKFITFLLSEKAKGILTAYGYTTNIPP